MLASYIILPPCNVTYVNKGSTLTASKSHLNIIVLPVFLLVVLFDIAKVAV